MSITTPEGISTEEQIKLLRESYKRRGNSNGSNIESSNIIDTRQPQVNIAGNNTTNPEFGDSDITSDFPVSDILQPASQSVSDILDKSITPTTHISTLDINLDEVYSTTLNRDLLIQNISRIELSIPELTPPHSTLNLLYLRNSINKGSNGKFLLKFVNDATKHIYYWDGEKKDGKITLYYISKREGKQFYKKYPHPVIIKGIIY